MTTNKPAPDRKTTMTTSSLFHGIISGPRRRSHDEVAERADRIASGLQKLGVKRYVDFEALTERGSCEGRLAGIVISARERKSQRGNKFAFAVFSVLFSCET